MFVYFGATHVKSRFGAIECERFRVRGAWRKPEPNRGSKGTLMGHSPSKSGGPAGSSCSFPPRIPPFSRLPKMRKRDTHALGRSANGGTDSRTMHPLGILSCARITRIRSGECLSITGCRRHVSISIHPRHAAYSVCSSARPSNVDVNWRILTSSEPRKGPTGTASRRKWHVIVSCGSSADKSVSFSLTFSYV